VPTYSYACTECGHRFEAVQAFSESSLTVCPVCSGKLRKVFSSVGIVFKGSGFYRTDSRAGAVPKGESKGESKGEKGSESKGSEGSGSESKGSDKGSDKAAPAKAASSGAKAGATVGTPSSSAPSKGA
jgi:putative FmdB family regulatory protein